MKQQYATHLPWVEYERTLWNAKWERFRHNLGTNYQNLQSL